MKGVSINIKATNEPSINTESIIKVGGLLVRKF